MPEITVGTHDYKWAEASTSGLGRAISMHRIGIANDAHVYKFNPNPHDDPFYNKKPGKWYSEAAEAIAVETEAHGWPADESQLLVHGTVYALQLQ